MRPLLALAGAVVAAVIIWRLGPADIFARLASGYWPAFALVVAAYALQQVMGTLALWLLGTNQTGPGWRATGILRLARVRYIGEVINYSMPTGGLGGEPYKYLALKGAEGRNTSLQSLMAAKFLHVTGVGPFAAGAFLLAARAGVGGEAWKGSFEAMAVISLIVTLAAWALVLWRGVGRALVGLFWRIRRKVPRRLRGVRRLVNVDRAASARIRRSPGRALVVYVLYIAMWWAAAAEWLAISMVVGVEGFGMTGGGVFECAQIIVAGAVPVPAGVGTQEAGKTAAAVLMGLDPATGVAMSLVRRGREALMVAVAGALGVIIGRGRGV